MELLVYNEAPSLDLKPVERELSELGIGLDVRPPLPPPQAAGAQRDAWLDWLSWHLAWSKVRQPDAPIPPGLEPQGLEVRRERGALERGTRFPGPLYDGVRLLETYHGPLPHEERPPGVGPIVVLTDRLVGTFEGSRYHVRFLVTGHPCIVSPPGLVDGPAREREYYVAKRLLGRDPEGVEGLGEDDHLSPGDARLPRCVASALLQAAMYHDAGDPFCEQETCRLYNPHWQAELLASMATDRLCQEHAAWVGSLA